MRINHTQSGFTLVEMVLYFTILAGVLFAIMTFSLEIVSVSKKSDILHEFQVNSSFISDKIISSIQQADAINDGSSVFDDDTGTLSITIDGADTEFYLSNNVVYMTEDAGPAVALNSDAIKCNVLRFEKITKTKVPDQVIIDAEFQANYVNDQSKQEPYTIHTSVSLRT